MSNKSFQAEYKGYMNSIKPSQELIEKTLMLAHQEQANLQRAKVQSNYKTLNRLNFKKYTALACTLIFAIFAVKLWSDQSREDIPSLPVETTISNEYTNIYQDNTTPTETPYNPSMEGQYTTNVSNFDYGTNSVAEYTTYPDEQFVSIITPSVSNSNDISSITSVSEVSSEDSSNVEVTTVPVSSDTTEETSTNNESMNSTPSSQTTQTTASSSTSTSTTAKPTETTPKPTETTPKPTENTTIATQTTAVTTTYEEAVNVVTTTRPITILETTSANNEANITTIEIAVSNTDSNDVNVEETAINGSVGGGIYVPEPQPDEDSACATVAPEVTPSPTTEYATYGIAMPNNIAGFAYNNTVLQGRIRSYFSFSDNIECIIPMGLYEDTSDCYAIIVVDVSNLNKTAVVREIQNCEYCYLISSSAVHYFETTTKDLDFNGNGIPPEDDDDDKQTILELIR